MCPRPQLALGALCLAFLISMVSAEFDVAYCSGLNTASTNKNSSIYQSNGLCHDFCFSTHAFAVVQDEGCWCSNYVPGTTASGCTQTCPGYPEELCGGSGVYGYIALAKSPSGTKGAASSSVASTSSTPAPMTVTATPDAVTIFSTISNDPTSSTIQSTSAQSATPNPTTSSTPDPTPTSSSSTWTPTAVISLETITGQVRTVTVTPTVPPNLQNTSPAVSKETTSGGGRSNGGLSTGGAIGLTVGLVVLAATIGTMIWYYLRKRRQEKAEAFADLSRSNSQSGALGSSNGPQVPSRTMSENSRYVLGTNGRQVVETWETENATAQNRQSQMIPVDPRLDPFAPLYHINKSRESVNTLRDDHDYSRRVQAAPILRMTNPD
ncbi:hypothetical protein BJ875DRAFT_149703 [Amylocarpus encephaloides]|uniref:WSC domain-containing protein n=1 Tax=Amylocarpus encephaloides TaxID=45428 RepID=A0A9P8C350_9HELO|nr:hypothetical protein BJ875DRAFT_149703 [Amylocarpus encephaloides]